jgi:CheY-like chemotaxis protein
MKRVLLVENSDDDIELARRALRKNDLEQELVVVQDGVEALDYLFIQGRHAGRDAADMPSVVLLDLELPGLHGLEVLKAIRAHQRTRYLPVVILSSSAADLDVERSYQLGANSYVQKPVDFSAFLETTRQLGLYWLTLNRRPA